MNKYYHMNFTLINLFLSIINKLLLKKVVLSVILNIIQTAEDMKGDLY